VSRSGSQQRTFLEILARLRPHWTTDAGLPARIDAVLNGDRRLGSRDRRLYRELTYAALRHLPWVEPFLDSSPLEASRRSAWLAEDSPDVQPFRAEVTADLPPCPADAAEKARILGADADLLSPGWLRSECPAAFSPPLREALLSRAPLWVRLQTTEAAAVFGEFDTLGWKWEPSDLCAGAVRLPRGADVSKTGAYAAGKIEIQDIGSQLILATAGIRAGGQWLDACAGAGGKTLQLAALLGAKGIVTARDTRRSALEELSARAARAGLSSQIRAGVHSDPPGGFDGVLVDAPCTGSGTWRRAPHLKWVTTAAGVRNAAATQLRLLRENAARARPGGRVLYATCSLCRSENESVVAEFLRGTEGFEEESPARTLLPQSHDGDGFFVACFRRSPIS
jgi:16S rRNA (cytosine967-C5)-methyltransferase